MKPFYMIYVEGANSPTYKHEELNAATEECKRLAIKTGKPAYILKCVGGYELNPSQINLED